MQCNACGQDNPGEFRFCGRCGVALGAGASSREVRKVVTIVFCDLTGSTALGDRTDPEKLRTIMAGYYEEMRRILERHGGMVEKFVGDAVMAVFGIPVSYEDDGLRAVRAAWQMRSAVDALGLSARIGVNTGEVVTGDGETLVTGDAVNVAARLEQLANPGEVLIGLQTQRLVRAAVVTEPVDLEVKGKLRSVSAYRLVSVDLLADAQARRLHTPLVGRKRELGVLHQSFQRTVTEQACHLFTLLGSAGVGKTRLVNELLSGIDATVLRGRCLSYGEGITYWPVVEVLKQLGPRAAATIELIDHGTGSARELFWAVRAELERAAGERPLVVVFDDIHWGEPTFLDLVDHIADLSREAPILLLCLARAELVDHRPGWGGGKLNSTTMLLEPMPAEDCAGLIDLLGFATDHATRDRVLQRAAGNPLFIEEMLALVEQGGDVRMPSTIQALLQARLDQLGVGERAVIERGAVEGEIFHQASVRELTPVQQRPDVDAHLVGLVRKELIRPTKAALATYEAFRFRHLLIRDAAYESLPKALRAQLHEGFADWLSAQEVVLVERDEILGYHLEQAAKYHRELGEPKAMIEQRAAERLEAAGSKALARDDRPASVNLLTRVLALLPDHDPRRTRILLHMLGALRGLGEVDQERRVIAELGSSDDADAQMHGRLARVDLGFQDATEGASDEAIQTARAAIDLFERSRDDAGLAHAWLVLFDVEWLRSQAVPALVAIEKALDHARRAADTSLLASLYRFRTGPLKHGPFTAETIRPKLTEMQRLAQDSPSMEQAVLMLESSLAAEAGRFAEALDCYERADAILGQLGLTMFRHLMTQHPADIALRQGRPADAARLFRKSFEGLGEVGATGFQSGAATNLARALYACGEPAEAERFATLGEAMGDSQDIGNFASGRSVRAMLLADRGEWAAAEEMGRSAHEFASRTDFPQIRGEAAIALAHVLRGRGFDEEAAGLVESAVASYESRGDVDSAARARRLRPENP
jgi:class 3 adenylate cyclase/tetratricopeptide (TPR) repeat protein